MGNILDKWITALKRLFRVSTRGYHEHPFAAAEPNMAIGSKTYYAEQMINNPIYQEVINNLIAQYKDKWEQSKSYDNEQREEYYQYLRAVKQIDAHIRFFVNARLENKLRDRQALEEATD